MNRSTINTFQNKTYNPFRFHLLVIIICGLSFSTTGTVIFTIAFNSVLPHTYTCNDTIIDKTDYCNNYYNNKDYICTPTPPYVNNIMVKYACDDYYPEYTSLMGVIYYIAMIFGSLFISLLINKIGRLGTMKYCGIVTIIGFIILYHFYNNLYLQYIALFILGSFGEFFYITAYMLGSELSGSTNAPTVSMLIFTIDGLTPIVGSMLIHYLQDMQNYYLLCLIRCIIAYILIYLLEESPYYYMIVGDGIKVSEVLNRVAEFNQSFIRFSFGDNKVNEKDENNSSKNNNIDNSNLSLKNDQNENVDKTNQDSNQNNTLSQNQKPKSKVFNESSLITTDTLNNSSKINSLSVIKYQPSPLSIVKVSIFALMWVCGMYLVYLLYFFAKNINLDMYTSLFVMGVAQTSCNFIGIVLNNKLGIKNSIMLNSVLYLIAAVTFIFLQNVIVQYTCIFMLILTGFLLWNTLFVYTDQSFEETQRGVVMSACCCIGRVGGLMAPIITEYMERPEYSLVVVSVSFIYLLQLSSDYNDTIEESMGVQLIETKSLGNEINESGSNEMLSDEVILENYNQNQGERELANYIQEV